MPKAIRFSRYGGPDVLECVEADAPPPGPGEVRLRQYAAGLNFIDIYQRSGLYQGGLPSGLGFEAAGVVESVGAGVEHLRAGDRVAYFQGPLGAYAEMRTMAARFVLRMPDALSFEEAAALMLKGMTVQYLFRQTRRLERGETILFHAAAGGVGLIACQWARALGVRLIGTVSSPEKAALAREHGAWETIDYSREDVVARVAELTEGRKVAVVYDSVGKDTWERSLDCLQPRGLMVSFGNASGPVTGVNLGVLAQKGGLFVTRPSTAVYFDTRERTEAGAAELFERVAAGDIRIRIGQRFALADAAAAHEALAARRTTGSTIFVMD